MKILILNDFTGSEDGINVTEFRRDEILDTNKKFADLVIANGNAELFKKVETKVIEPDENKNSKEVTAP